MGELPVAEIQRAAAMGQPAHDDLVARQDLLAVDAQVLAVFPGAFGDHQCPGDEGPGVAGPAGLNRQASEVNLIGVEDMLLAGRALQQPRRHIQHFPEYRQFLPGILHALRRFGFLEGCQQFADAAQGVDRVRAHARGDAFGGTEQVGQYRYVGAPGVLEQQGGPAGAQGAVANLGDFEAGVDRVLDPPQLAAVFQLADEIT